MKSIEIRPKVLFACHETLMGLLSSYYYARETIYSNTQYSIFNITSSYTLYSDPYSQLQDSLTRFRSISGEHLQMIQTENLMSSSVLDIYYNKDSSAHPYTSLGLAYSHTTFQSDLLSFSSLGLCPEASKLISEYHIIYDELRKVHFLLSETVVRTIESRILDEMRLSIWVIGVFSIQLILFYLLILLPVIHKIDQVVTSAWTFFNELHLGDIEDEDHFTKLRRH
jgi:hypothetical protein